MSGSKTILTTVLVLILAGSTISLWRSCSRRSPALRGDDWFYDLNTSQLFPGPRGAIPPIDAPSGPLPDGSPAGVRARVFGCDGCSEDQRTIAWLETYPVEQRDQLTPPPPPPPSSGAGTQELMKPFMPTVQFEPLIKRVDDPAWVSRAAPEGAELIASALPKCGGDLAPQECWP